MARRARKNPIFHVEGAEELNRALRSVGDRAGGLTLRKAAEAGAKIIAEEARQRAPKDTGALAAGIGHQPHRLQHGRAQFNVGIGRREWYGKLVELGTAKMPAQPFLRPAFDAKKGEATKAVRDVLRSALKGVLSS